VSVGVPKTTREAVAAVIVLELLLKGVHFDSADVWAMPFGRTSVTRTFRRLVDAGVISKSPVKGKYRFGDKFLDALTAEITRGMPRDLFLHYPDLKIFDVSGIGEWKEEELDRYVARLKERWKIRREQAGFVVTDC
jgi:hypothetical protein